MWFHHIRLEGAFESIHLRPLINHLCEKFRVACAWVGETALMGFTVKRDPEARNYLAQTRDELLLVIIFI